MDKKVGQYTIIRKIATGSFAKVYEVKNPRGEKLALKMVIKGRTVSAALIEIFCV